ncbi:TRAP transporter small permease [Achromobacter xylosoxidans]|uniref:TRAP transporter small permease n=1 Tax=Alcaligenes xylosoxydans xylosoxydans TaxID=85698 RepID=UPI000B490480|nr:TRAP transporter small permease [Achromobacter xylosoxidans]
MWKFLDKHLEEMLTVLLLSVMSLLICAQVFMRYVMDSSLAWSEELARYCFIWATYLGVSYAVKRNAHICVEAVVSRFPDRLKACFVVLSHLLFIVFAALVVKEGYALTLKIFKFGQTSSSLGLPMGLIYLAPTVGFGLVILRLIQSIFVELGALRQGARA